MTHKNLMRKLLKRHYTDSNIVLEDCDTKMITEVVNNYSLLEDYSNLKCLDLGGNIGAFAKYAFLNGASSVTSIEPDHRNLDIIERSFKDTDNFVFRSGAIVPKEYEESTVTLYKSNSVNSHSSQSIYKKGRHKEYSVVEAFKFLDIYNSVKPDLLKIDIEGAEYDIMEDVIEAFPDKLFIEFHLTVPTKEKYERFSKLLTEKYNHSTIEPIVYFSRVCGYDCYFSK